MQRYRVNPGTPAHVASVNDRADWRPYQTKKLCEFDEPISRSRSQVTFRRGRWLLRVKPGDVRVHNGIRWQPFK